jgi:hypothetical protein
MPRGPIPLWKDVGLLSHLYQLPPGLFELDTGKRNCTASELIHSVLQVYRLLSKLTAETDYQGTAKPCRAYSPITGQSLSHFRVLSH